MSQGRAAESAGSMIYRGAPLRHIANGASQKVRSLKSVYPVSEPVCRRGDRPLSGLHLAFDQVLRTRGDSGTAEACQVTEAFGRLERYAAGEKRHARLVC